MNDFIKINSLEVFGYHGTIHEERKLGQKYYINLNVYPMKSFRDLREDICNTVDYSKLVVFVRKYFEKNARDLLETIAYEIVVKIFSKFQNIVKVDLEIFKPAYHVDVGFEGMSVFCSRSIHKVYISLGSNLGDREQNLNNAYEMIEQNDIVIVSKSKMIETDPYGNVPQGKFLNSVIECNTILTPYELMEVLLNVESKLKRERMIKWGPRTIDLDILLYDNEIINEDGIVIPHYDMQNRDFVLEPLCYINRFSYNPRLGKFAFEMLEDLKNTKSTV